MKARKSYQKGSVTKVKPSYVTRRITITHSLWRRELQTPKIEGSERTVGMSPELADVLVDHLDQTSFSDSLFCQSDGSPIDPDSLRRLGIYPALEKAGIPFVKRASGCHAFRHLAGSLIHRETGSIKLAQTQLGHSNSHDRRHLHAHRRERARPKCRRAGP